MSRGIYKQTKTGKQLSDFDIYELMIKVLKEKGYLTPGLVARELNLFYPVSVKMLYSLESTTGLVKLRRFDLGKSFVQIWFKSKPEEISDD